jgi:hypothetical protein
MQITNKNDTINTLNDLQKDSPTQLDCPKHKDLLRQQQLLIQLKEEISKPCYWESQYTYYYVNKIAKYLHRYKPFSNTLQKNPKLLMTPEEVFHKIEMACDRLLNPLLILNNNITLSIPGISMGELLAQFSKLDLDTRHQIATLPFLDMIHELNTYGLITLTELTLSHLKAFFELQQTLRTILETFKQISTS